MIGLLPGLWLFLFGGRGDRARWQPVQVRDVWGHDPSLQLAVRSDGRVLPLIWQGRLTGALLKGRLNVYGPRPQLDTAAATPRDAAEIVAFWQGTPRAPGLTGDWATAAPAPILRTKRQPPCPTGLPSGDSSGPTPAGSDE